MITPLATSSTNVLYLDLNVLISDADPYEVVTNEASIYRSIITILSTKRGSRVFNRLFGCDIEDYLWQPMDTVTQERLRIAIKDVITTWEKRISVTQVIVRADTDNSQYYVSVSYTIPKLNDKSDTLNFNLKK